MVMFDMVRLDHSGQKNMGEPLRGHELWEVANALLGSFIPPVVAQVGIQKGGDQFISQLLEEAHPSNSQ
jgi:hypothetical protein